MPLEWPDDVDEILVGDHNVLMAHRTPAAGVVLSPLTNLRLRDRAAGTLTPVGTSVGMWRKIARVQDDPQVAIAFCTREHGRSTRPEYVLVQGAARVVDIGDQRDLLPPRSPAILDGWLRVYHERVAFEVAVERLVVWPDVTCPGTPEIHGSPLPEDPPAPQAPPRKGTEPRVDHARAARRAARMPHVLLGWAGADGFPVVAPVEVAGSDERGIVLEPPPGVVPPGGRRAGLVAHWFTLYGIGQDHRRYTGWMEPAGDGRVVYAPHTDAGYRFPSSRWVFWFASGYGTRRGLRQARQAGVYERFRSAAAASSSRSSP
jgi:hypothetical protein